MSSDNDVSGIEAASTFSPMDCSAVMTWAQLEPSAHAPWTSTTLAFVSDSLIRFRLAPRHPDPPACSGVTGGQRRQFLETAMDVDLDERCGLAGCVRGAFDADTVQ